MQAEPAYLRVLPSPHPFFRGFNVLFYNISSKITLAFKVSWAVKKGKASWDPGRALSQLKGICICHCLLPCRCWTHKQVMASPSIFHAVAKPRKSSCFHSHWHLLQEIDLLIVLPPHPSLLLYILKTHLHTFFIWRIILRTGIIMAFCWIRIHCEGSEWASSPTRLTASLLKPSKLWCAVHCSHSFPKEGGWGVCVLAWVRTQALLGHRACCGSRCHNVLGVCWQKY